MNQIQKQYQMPKNLTTRICIHEKYSVNPEPFNDWVFSHYKLGSGMRILELGCGTAEIWKKRRHDWDGIHLTLTDFSEGMLQRARENTGGFSNVEYRIVDIQSIPWGENTFDCVIANMMLYHVPDLKKGLGEVCRVLKPGGQFCCATYGEHGIMEFVNESLCELGIHGQVGGTFTLQNGASILGQFFDDVELFTRDDALAVRRVEDFTDYVCSLSGLTGIADTDRTVLTEAFEKRTEKGILYIPKEYGMFICK